MAIRLVAEVMDWAPPLTHREHKVLMILAENARLPSRETWDSVEDPKILRRARLTRTQMYAVIGALVDKGCLVRSVWGGRDHRAKYVIARVGRPVPDHDQCPQNRDTDHGPQCPGIQDTDHDGQDHDQCPRKPGPRLPLGTGSTPAQAEGATAAEAKTPDAAERGRAAEGGTQSRTNGQIPTPSRTRKRVHDGPNLDGPDDQHIAAGVHLQSPAADRNAREETELARQAAANALTEWERQHPEFSA